MSPEQIRDSKKVGPATDIWSLGVILYELLTGETPFSADTAPALYAMIAADPPRPLRELRPELPGSLEAICMRCLEKRPDVRFGDAGELAAALAPFVADSANLDADANPAKPEPDAGGTTVDPAPPRLPRSEHWAPSSAGAQDARRSRRRLFAFAAAGALAMVAAAAALSGMGGANVSIAERAHVDGGLAIVSVPALSSEPAALSAPALPIEPDATTQPKLFVEPAPQPPVMPAKPHATRQPELVVQRPASGEPSRASSVDGQGAHHVDGPAPRGSASTASVGSSRCDPPFVIDPTTGTRRVKPGC